MYRRIRTLLLALAWLGAAALVALGGAGIVASMDHVPGTATRPELTWPGDTAAASAMDAATATLERLAADMDAFGTSARLALAQVAAGSTDGLQQTIASGTIQLDAVKLEAAKLEASLAAIPGVGPGAELRLSAETRRRFEKLAGTSGITAGIEADWAAFAERALDAASLTALLARHDRQTGAAAREGSAAHYREALDALDASDATLAEARAARDRLAGTTDVAALTEWLDRNADYDAALRDLYRSLLTSKGRVTPAVRRAFEAERVAYERLPDGRGLVVIMADVSQGGLNQTVISIEEARGALDAALDEQRPLSETPTQPE
jgi:hypothetical protein